MSMIVIFGSSFSFLLQQSIADDFKQSSKLYLMRTHKHKEEQEEKKKKELREIH